jgi:hypothetical protein
MFWDTLRKLIIANPMGIFIYTILTKWYLMIAVGGLVVAFWVFKGLEESGVLHSSWQVVEKAVNDAKSVARYCVPKITDIRSFWYCLEHPPKYQRTKDEELLIEKLQNVMPNSSSITEEQKAEKNPYD